MTIRIFRTLNASRQSIDISDRLADSAAKYPIHISSMLYVSSVQLWLRNYVHIEQEIESNIKFSLISKVYAQSQRERNGNTPTSKHSGISLSHRKFRNSTPTIHILTTAGTYNMPVQWWYDGLMVGALAKRTRPSQRVICYLVTS